MVRNAPSMPEPEADARSHSARVAEAVGDAIDAAGGFIPFAQYMQIVLYAPGLGYYVSGTRKFGAGGDFITAPERTSLFGATLSADVAAILRVATRRHVVELGAGSGKLAAAILDALARAGTSPSRYSILELGPELRERQRETIGRLAPTELARVEWLTDLPRVIDGAVLMNEVLDAIPPVVIARRDDRWLERGVIRRDDGFAWSDRPLDDERLRTLAAARFPARGDYESEINVAAEALIGDIGGRLASGAIVIVDYGFPRAEYYHPQRREGTLRGHYRHRAHVDPFLWPGLSDLTANVDFTAIAEAGERAGLTVAGFASQASYLLSCGLLDRLQSVGAPESAAYLREAAAVQTLTSPAEMGELVKVLALARSDDIEWSGFALADMSHRL